MNKILGGIGDRLIHIRDGLSQAAFAAQCGMHKNTLGHYERGERGPDAGFLGALADAGYNINWVLTGAGPMRLAQMPAAGVDVDAIRDIERHMHAVIEAQGLAPSPEQKAKWVGGLYAFIVREGITGEDERAKVVRLVVGNGS